MEIGESGGVVYGRQCPNWFGAFFAKIGRATLVISRYILNQTHTREEPIQEAYGLPKDPTPKWQLRTALPPPFPSPLASGKRE